LINDILDLAQMESGKISLNVQPNDINQIIQSVGEIQRNVAKNKGLDLTVKLDPQMTTVTLDADRITQVISNLINNAIKFTEVGGITVESQCFPEHNHIKVFIRDTGPGIKKDDLTKLFQKFQQLEEPVYRKTGGTGLGLAICKQIVHLHGGKIDVESQWGHGSNFYFILPIEERRKRE
jgi:signal transduction histidine kinase